MEPRELLRAMFDAAVAAAQPANCVPRFLPEDRNGTALVIGAGKASAAMARAVEDRWTGPLSGLVVTRYGHRVPTRRIEVVEAAHPVPDEAGEAAARRILAMMHGLGPDDLVIAVMSGGASALLPLPAPGVTLADKQAVNRALLAAGAPIGAMNAVRKHLSAIKGGRLAAAAHPARVLTLAISDIPGDDPAAIGSGPTVADPTTRAEALAVLDRYGVVVPAAVRRHLDDPASETPKPGDPRLARAETIIVARPMASLEAAAATAAEHGVRPIILGDAIEGEARDVGMRHTRLVRGQPGEEAWERLPDDLTPPFVLLSGGETTVTVRGAGRGGRNVEFLLALAIGLDGAAGTHAIAGDTDGIDGAEDVAGAIIGPDTLSRAYNLGLDLVDRLDENDAHTAFAALGDQVITGPTLTNVNDFRAVLVTG